MRKKGGGCCSGRVFGGVIANTAAVALSGAVGGGGRRRHRWRAESERRGRRVRGALSGSRKLRKRGGCRRVAGRERRQIAEQIERQLLQRRRHCCGVLRLLRRERVQISNRHRQIGRRNQRLLQKARADDCRQLSTRSPISANLKVRIVAAIFARAVLAVLVDAGRRLGAAIDALKDGSHAAAIVARV